MFNLFFGSLWSIVSTAFLLLSLGYIILTTIKHKEIKEWGRRIITLAIIGVLLCIFVVMRDDYVAFVQAGTANLSRFYLAYAGAAIIAFTLVTSLIIRKQKYRKTMFFILSGAIIFKAIVIEITRILM